MHLLAVFFDADADRRIRDLRRRTGLTAEFPPHLVYAAAGTIGPKVRTELKQDLARLWLPDLWFNALSATENSLHLSAVVDAELLAVHSAIHDVLAGRVKHPDAYHLPGSWTPRTALATERLAGAFAELHPVEPIRARVREMSIVDTQTAEVDVLRRTSAH
ncbi:2'-5' RNA ligase family protein [Actinosynnema sp. NPDC020468]|uniref:2'-5' RNA ligase family protein n=1 Tax=Actinosynnema sp. NPDC020468 TaxID=3154488 RepID=UPI003403F932